MPTDLILPIGFAFSLLAWSLIIRWYVHPYLRQYPLQQALTPLLLLHTFRYIGLMFLIPGVTAEILDTRFSHPAAYGDLIAAGLAFIAIGAIRINAKWALGAVWIFNIWGLLDLVNAVARGLLYNSGGDLGATYWIPAAIVPLLLVTHGYIFILLAMSLRKEKHAKSHSMAS